jgi:hypothetical protein
MILRQARKALGVLVRRQGFGKDGRFLLALPSNGTDPLDGARESNGNGYGLDHADSSPRVGSTGRVRGGTEERETAPLSH